MGAELFTTGEHHLRRRDFFFESLSGLLGLGLLAAFVWGAWLYAHQSVTFDWPFTTAILALPLLQVPLLILLLRKNSDFGRSAVLLLAPSLFLEVLLWFAFMFRQTFPRALAPASVAGLIWALVLGGVGFWVTALIMGLADGKSQKFQRVLRRQPFLVVCFFLTIFTFIALFLSLSLALHDQDLRLNHKSLGLFAKEVGLFGQDQPADEKISPSAAFTILFRQGSAALEFVSLPEPSPDDEEFEAPSDPENRRKLHNARHLKRLTEAILEAAEKDRVRIVLAGHSDDLPMDVRNASYKSNFELSEARIHHVIVGVLVQLATSQQKEWRRNIEWLVLPCANEEGFLRQGQRRSGEDLSVEVLLLASDGDRFSSVNQPGGRALDLLDYLYFGIYTITTTGYGDIIPVSSYSKFITCVANFFEVFFMVVFFNVLLSFLREGSGPCDPDRAAASS